MATGNGDGTLSQRRLPKVEIADLKVTQLFI
jgi:hypothetical protein